MQPRLFTPPARDLSDPAASWGHDFIDFCAMIGFPLDPWQCWLAIHLGELRPDCTPRYRKALILVARQNGKSLFARLLILYWMWVERVEEIIATSTDRAAAKRSWLKAVKLAECTPLLAENLEPRHTALQIGEEDFWNTHGSHYRFAAPTRRAGRGDTVPRALLDELREHRNRDVWDAIVPAMNAVPDALLVCISNEGDAESIVLHEEVDAAELFIQTGEGDPRTFLASWSAASGAPADDLDGLAQANPGLGHRVQVDALLGQARAAMAAGGETLARFRIEMLCQRVDLLAAAIRIEAWKACGRRPKDEAAVDLAQHRRQVALVFDVAQDGSHATAVACAVVDGVAHIDVVAAWNGFDCRKQLRKDLPGIVRTVKPRKVGWFAGGPAAAVADQWPSGRLAGVLLEPIRAEDVVRACMGLEETVEAGGLRHSNDPLVDQHIRQTQQLPQGDGWRFARRGQQPIDASYAVAGAVHMARVLPKLGPAV